MMAMRFINGLTLLVGELTDPPALKAGQRQEHTLTIAPNTTCVWGVSECLITSEPVFNVRVLLDPPVYCVAAFDDSSYFHVFLGSALCVCVYVTSLCNTLYYIHTHTHTRTHFGVATVCIHRTCMRDPCHISLEARGTHKAAAETTQSHLSGKR